MKINQCWYKDRCPVECSDSCIRFNSIKSLFEHSLLPKPQWVIHELSCRKTDLDAFTKLSEISDNINDWVMQGRNLYIYSDICGNGKTSWSIKLLYSWFNSIWHKSGFDCHGLFISVPKLLYDHRRNMNTEVKGFDELCEKILSVELVVWDDLPSRTLTEYEHQVLFQFIDARINAGLSNIITGNQNKLGCMSRIGDRLTSRLFYDEAIEFKEPDKRGMNNGRITDYQ